MGDEEEACNTGLGLGLGLGIGQYVPKSERPKKDKPLVRLELSFPLLHPKEEMINLDHKAEGSSSKTMENEEEYAIRSINNSHSSHSNKSCSRKKLRLTREQSTLLEDSFKLHTTLNPAQKQALAERLNLRPRQVEVWFQNRRARTKLKQTEVDCEFLKKCCESLSDENRRLKKELQELRSQKLGAAPLYIQLAKAAATLAMCTSCEKIVKAGGEGKKMV
ncbi:hypothetical protein L1049_000204 [Liquidambar formosana]|uniref:Homeobox domain-containing protein n=1 Tax=Liquidambar formosana TaxID=63359 RepID=A0AAP0R574_LIQFO